MKQVSLAVGSALGIISVLWSTAADARFLQVDPVGYKDSIHLYAYVGNDPIGNRDPTGKDCVSANGTTICTTSTYKVSFPTQSGWTDPKSSDPNYHFYSTPGRTDWDPKSTQSWVQDHPTPGMPSPATPQGTVNDATPVLGGLSPVNISPVKSFALTNELSGKPVTVNVTLPGHPLQNGIVVRQVDSDGKGGSVIQNWGEGNGNLQRPGSNTAPGINGIWRDQVPSPSIAHMKFCQTHPGAGC